MFVSEDIQEQRLAHCNQCEFYTKLNFCSKCNCFMPVKVKLAYKSCPIGLWHSENELLNK